MMADNSVTNPAYANDYLALMGAEASSPGSPGCLNSTLSNPMPSDPSEHFFDTPTGSYFQAAFQTVGAELTSSRLVPNGASTT